MEHMSDYTGTAACGSRSVNQTLDPKEVTCKECLQKEREMTHQIIRIRYDSDNDPTNPGWVVWEDDDRQWQPVITPDSDWTDPDFPPTIDVLTDDGDAQLVIED
jgi:hypothetical protein